MNKILCYVAAVMAPNLISSDFKTSLGLALIIMAFSQIMLDILDAIKNKDRK